MKKIKFLSFFLLIGTITFSQCISGNCKNGNGTYKYENGSVYIGQWWNDEMNGNGTLIWPDGSIYVGEFKHGLYHGNGTQLNLNEKNILYVGEYKEEMENGTGTMIFQNKEIYVEMKEGKMNGY